MTLTEEATPMAGPVGGSTHEVVGAPAAMPAAGPAQASVEETGPAEAKPAPAEQPEQPAPRRSKGDNKPMPAASIYLYKTALCWAHPSCTNPKCTFAHGVEELRTYKTRMCPAVKAGIFCEQGPLCQFAHTKAEIRQVVSLQEYVERNGTDIPQAVREASKQSLTQAELRELARRKVQRHPKAKKKQTGGNGHRTKQNGHQTHSQPKHTNPTHNNNVHGLVASPKGKTAKSAPLRLNPAATPFDFSMMAAAIPVFFDPNQHALLPMPPPDFPHGLGGAHFDANMYPHAGVPPWAMPPNAMMHMDPAAMVAAGEPGRMPPEGAMVPPEGAMVPPDSSMPQYPFMFAPPMAVHMPNGNHAQPPLQPPPVVVPQPLPFPPTR